jgi:hypothetical protein
MVFTSTELSWLLLVLGHLRPEWIVRVAACYMWGNLVSFSCTPLFDETAYSRLRSRRGWTVWQFWGGHIVLHMLPLYYLRELTFRWYDGVAAAMIHSCWVHRVCLNDVYAPLPVMTWVALVGIAHLTEILIPHVMNNL